MNKLAKVYAALARWRLVVPCTTAS